MAASRSALATRRCAPSARPPSSAASSADQRVVPGGAHEAVVVDEVAALGAHHHVHRARPRCRRPSRNQIAVVADGGRSGAVDDRAACRPRASPPPRPRSDGSAGRGVRRSTSATSRVTSRDSTAPPPGSPNTPTALGADDLGPHDEVRRRRPAPGAMPRRGASDVTATGSGGAAVAVGPLARRQERPGRDGHDHRHHRTRDAPRPTQESPSAVAEARSSRRARWRPRWPAAP